MDDSHGETETLRRRLNKAAECTKIAWLAFREWVEILLPRPMMTYLYNYLMNKVDRRDQRSASFPMQRTHVKEWKALFCSLTNIIVVNTFLLSFALRGSLRYPEIDDLFEPLELVFIEWAQSPAHTNKQCTTHEQRREYLKPSGQREHDMRNRARSNFGLIDS